MMIKNLKPRMAERGKIKIGNKGEERKSAGGAVWQPPKKLDHFIVVTLDRGTDGNFVKDEAVHALIGEAPRRIPVRLQFNDIEMNMMSRYASYAGKTMWCSGDGEKASRVKEDGTGHEEVQCPCFRLDRGYKGKDRCKINGALSVIIDGVAGVGSVWTFRTTSWNSVNNLLSSMYQIRALSGGVLAGLPLDLVLSPKEVTDPDGKTMKAWVVSLEYVGTVDDLREIGFKRLEADARHNVRIQLLEETVKANLMLPAPVDAPLVGDDPTEIADEFYAEEPSVIPPRPTPKPTVETYRVYDQWGEEVSSEDCDRKAAARKLKELVASTDVPHEIEALKEVNGDLWADVEPAAIDTAYLEKTYRGYVEKGDAEARTALAAWLKAMDKSGSDYVRKLMAEDKKRKSDNAEAS